VAQDQGPWPQGFRVDLDWTRAWVVVRVSGHLDMATSSQLERQIIAAAALRRPPRLALDLSDLRFCDTNGLGLLVASLKRVRRDDGNLVLVQPPPQLQGLLQRTGLHRLFELRDAIPDGE
jgi:anti-sigma B factor antagonist